MGVLCFMVFMIFLRRVVVATYLQSALVLNLEAPDDRFLKLRVVAMVVLVVDGLELFARGADHDGLLDESMSLAPTDASVSCFNTCLNAGTDVEAEAHGRKLGLFYV